MTSMLAILVVGREGLLGGRQLAVATAAKPHTTPENFILKGQLGEHDFGVISLFNDLVM